PETLATTWFDSPFFGSWKIIGIGLHAFDYNGALPHSPGVGSIDMTKLCPYVDVEFPDAPAAVIDETGSMVDEMIIGGNDRAIGFVEGTPFSAFRMVAGTGVDPQNIEDGNVFLVPRKNSEKMTDIFGSALTAWHKVGFE